MRLRKLGETRGVCNRDEKYTLMMARISLMTTTMMKTMKTMKEMKMTKNFLVGAQKMTSNIADYLKWPYVHFTCCSSLPLLAVGLYY